MTIFTATSCSNLSLPPVHVYLFQGPVYAYYLLQGFLDLDLSLSAPAPEAACRNRDDLARWHEVKVQCRSPLPFALYMIGIPPHLILVAAVFLWNSLNGLRTQRRCTVPPEWVSPSRGDGHQPST